MSKQTTKGRIVQTNTNSSIKFDINPKQAERLNAMVETGLWGSSVGACIKRIVDLHLLKEDV